jgi:hypothetical protein
VRLAECHLVDALDALIGSESTLVHELAVDPDEPAELDVRRVVRAEDRRSVVAVPEDDLDLIGRPGVGERGEREHDHEQYRSYQQLLHSILLVVGLL